MTAFACHQRRKWCDCYRPMIAVAYSGLPGSSCLSGRCSTVACLQVTAIVYANPNWASADGGKLRLWLPKTQPHSQSLSAPQSPEARHPTSQPAHASTAPANGRPVNPHTHAHAQVNGTHIRHSSLVSNASQSSGSSATGPILANGNGHAQHGLSEGPVNMNGHAHDPGRASSLDDSPRASADMHYQTDLPGPTQTANLADIHPQTMRRLDNGHAHAGPARLGVHFADDLNMHLPNSHAGQNGHLSMSMDEFSSDAPSTPRGAGSSALADHASDQASSKSDPPGAPASTCGQACSVTEGSSIALGHQTAPASLQLCSATGSGVTMLAIYMCLLQACFTRLLHEERDV